MGQVELHTQDILSCLEYLNSHKPMDNILDGFTWSVWSSEEWNWRVKLHSVLLLSHHHQGPGYYSRLDEDPVYKQSPNTYPLGYKTWSSIGFHMGRKVLRSWHYLVPSQWKKSPMPVRALNILIAPRMPPPAAPRLDQSLYRCHSGSKALFPKGLSMWWQFRVLTLVAPQSGSLLKR